MSRAPVLHNVTQQESILNSIWKKIIIINDFPLFSFFCEDIFVLIAQSFLKRGNAVFIPCCDMNPERHNWILIQLFEAHLFNIFLLYHSTIVHFYSQYIVRRVEDLTRRRSVIHCCNLNPERHNWILINISLIYLCYIIVPLAFFILNILLGVLRIWRGKNTAFAQQSSNMSDISVKSTIWRQLT